MSAKTVYFHIDEMSRDAIVASWLKTLLASHGVNLVYGNRISSQLLRNNSPFDLLILPKLDFLRSTFNAPEDIPCPVILMPTEDVGGFAENPDRPPGVLGVDFKRDGVDPWTEKIHTFFVWGAATAEKMKVYAPYLLDRVAVLGHPRHDDRCIPLPPQQRADKIVVGLVSRFSLINSFDSRERRNFFFIHDVSKKRAAGDYMIKNFGERDIEDLYYTSVIDFRIMLDVIDALDPKTHEIQVRVHPREDRTQWEELIAQRRLNVRLSAWDEPFQYWLRGVDYVVSPPSTSFFDSIAANKRILCTDRVIAHRINHTLRHSEDAMSLLQFLDRPQSLEELVAALQHRPDTSTRLLDNPGLAAYMAQWADYPNSRTSLDRAVERSLDALGQHQTRHSGAQRVMFDCMAAFRNRRRRNMIEQSCMTLLTKDRRRWIDQLTESGR